MNIIGIYPGIGGGLAVLNERGEFVSMHDRRRALRDAIRNAPNRHWHITRSTRAAA